jgi:UDP-glucuronate decarboxylase
MFEYTMRIMVAGGAGFLGSHLCENLLEDGHEVVCVDNFYTGSTDNIKHLKDRKKFTILQHDITSPISISVDGIFNLACPASPIHYQKDPIQTLKTSVYGSINLLELAKQTKARILQASTSEIYGDPLVTPQSEKYWGNVNSFGVRSCYDEGKRAAETLFHDYHVSFNTDVRVARIFNTYGPNMAFNDGRVVSNYITQALKGKPLTVYGDGSQTRSFCYVDDLIKGLKLLFFKEHCHEPVNLGNPNPVSMKELANEVIALSASNSKLIYLPLPEDDPKSREPDIQRAIEVLGWSPEIERKVGIQKTIQYFQNSLSSEIVM